MLTSTPLGRLPPITNPDDYMDDFLLGILKRVREEYPDFADGLFAKEGLYADTIKPSIDKKPWQFLEKMMEISNKEFELLKIILEDSISYFEDKSGNDFYLEGGVTLLNA